MGCRSNFNLYFLSDGDQNFWYQRPFIQGKKLNQGMAIVMRQESYHFAHTVLSKATIFAAFEAVLIMR